MSKKCANCGKPYTAIKRNSGYCRECHTKLAKEWRSKRIENGLCVTCGKENDRHELYFTCGICQKKESARKQIVRRKAKMDVIDHYGNGKCACCGESHIEFLTIDHINGHGNSHRNALGKSYKSGKNFYRWLQRNKYPEGFRVLCFNCNESIGLYGYCPHNNVEEL